MKFLVLMHVPYLRSIYKNFLTFWRKSKFSNSLKRRHKTWVVFKIGKMYKSLFILRVIQISHTIKGMSQMSRNSKFLFHLVKSFENKII